VEETEMTRRKLLEWAARTLGALCGAVVAVPGMLYLLDPLRRRTRKERGFNRVARLAELPPGVPRELPVRDVRRDAWTSYPQETIGRVWLVRRSDEPSASSAVVDCYATACPHLGCAIGFDAAKKRFVCPCHKAGFHLTGRRLSESELGQRNPSPRDMDSLDCRIGSDEATGEKWVEVRFERFRFGPTTKIAIG
jgi:menaquinol-cytochrome c reductase iron-sulfur subunit